MDAEERTKRLLTDFFRDPDDSMERCVNRLHVSTVEAIRAAEQAATAAERKRCAEIAREYGNTDGVSDRKSSASMIAHAIENPET